MYEIIASSTASPCLGMYIQGLKFWNLIQKPSNLAKLFAPIVFCTLLFEILVPQRMVRLTKRRPNVAKRHRELSIQLWLTVTLMFLHKKMLRLVKYCLMHLRRPLVHVVHQLLLQWVVIY